MSNDSKSGGSKKASDASQDLFERGQLSEKRNKEEENVDLNPVSHGEELFLQNIHEGTHNKPKEYIKTDELVQTEVDGRSVDIEEKKLDESSEDGRDSAPIINQELDLGSRQNDRTVELSVSPESETTSLNSTNPNLIR